MPPGEVASGQRAVYHRLKGSYSPTYLTILSVVQAVAMGDLAQVVAAGYQDFTLVQWVLTFNTFGVLIITWNVFSVQSALWSWIPDVRDSAAPFMVGALELYPEPHHHGVVERMAGRRVAGRRRGRGWARCISPGARVVRRSISNCCGWLRVHIRLYVAYLIAGGGFLLALAWVCSADHLNLHREER